MWELLLRKLCNHHYNLYEKSIGCVWMNPDWEKSANVYKCAKCGDISLEEQEND